MRLWSVDGNRQRLDGGAMYGNAPRALWEKWTPPDAQNRIEFACRCLLVRDVGGKTVLLETGIGAFFEPKLRSRYGVHEDEHVLLRSLAAHDGEDLQRPVSLHGQLRTKHSRGKRAEPPWTGTLPRL